MDTTDGRFYKIRPASERDRDERMLEMLRQPHIANKVDEVAKRLNANFNSQTKVMINIRPGARFENTMTKQVFVYEATVPPFHHHDMVRLTLQEAKRPVEDLQDQGYMIIRTLVPGTKTDIVLTEDAGERFVMPGREFVAYFCMEIFRILDMANSDEKDLIEKAWRPKPRVQS